jgi:hypothetical protein
MACDLTISIAKRCKDNLGGTRSLFLYNYIAAPFTVTTGEAVAINVGLTVVREYYLEGEENSLTQVQETSDTNTVNTSTVVASIIVADAATSAELNLLCYGGAGAVIKDRNGEYYAVAVENTGIRAGQFLGMKWSVTEATGAAFTDKNGYTLTGIGMSGSLCPKLDAATATAFEALVV